MNNTTFFRNLLQQELDKRCKDNPLYSMRAFAKYLGVEPSYLSKLLRGKSPIGDKTIQRLGPKIGIGPKEVQYYRSVAQNSKFTLVEIDQFELISEWYHYAILELIKLDNFCASPKWIAAQLNVPVNLIKKAIERLFDLGHLTLSDEGQWIQGKGNNTTTGHLFTNKAFKNLQKGILKQSLLAIEEVPFEQRSHSSMTMAIDRSKLSQAQDLITQFRRQMSELLETGPQKDDVYQLQISLFPVTQNYELNQPGEIQ